MKDQKPLLSSVCRGGDSFEVVGDLPGEHIKHMLDGLLGLGRGEELEEDFVEGGDVLDGHGEVLTVI